MNHIPQLLDTIVYDANIDSTDDQLPNPNTINAEIHLLQLPIFVLNTHSLRSIEGLRYQGSVNRDGVRQDYVFRTSRTRTGTYPGLLARSAHFALMSILGERRTTTENPITWTWRDFCRRIGCSCSGRSVQRLKIAIRATAELTLSSQNAICINRPQEQPTTLHLYDKVVFAREQLDGQLVRRNHLWMTVVS